MEIWRYPVKSMGGERIDTAMIGNRGLAGDRCWAVINGETREICTAKRWPELLNYQASLQSGECMQSSGFGEDVPEVHVRCPDGNVISGRAPDVELTLSEKLGRQADLAPLAPPSNRDHYRLAQARTEDSIAREMQLHDGEDLPDFTATPEELMNVLADCVTPPGTYVDAFPLHLMTTNSLRYLSENGSVEAVTERYRPNFLIEPTEQGSELTENTWLDHRVRLGEAVLHIHSRTVRCSMPSREQKWCGLDAEKNMARAMVDHCERHLGVNVTVEKGGVVSVGDELLLTD